MADQLDRIRILLVDDHPLTRDGIRACLAAAPHIEVAAEAADGREALRQIPKVAPDVVVMDVNMPGLNGLAATAALRRKLPEARVLVLTMYDHPEYVMEMMRAGARGYVSKEAPPSELISGIEVVAAGGLHFSLAETTRYVRLYGAAQAGVPARPIKDLSLREREVLALSAQGLSNREISERLQLAVRTVETYRERLMRKLDLHDVTALRFYAAAHGIILLGSDGNNGVRS
jgi:two-component system, NarL family, nitrate/nitrite response regulator NarL